MSAARERIEVVQADITTLHVDAIVNAANEALLGGGGVDGAIHRTAGPELMAACRNVPEVRSGVRCPTGEARLTPGFRLPARFVIHTVGPVWDGAGRGASELLAACYANCLALAKQHDLRSVAFPAISCGRFGYPSDQAAAIAVREVRRVLATWPEAERILLVAYDAAARAVLEQAIAARAD